MPIQNLQLMNSNKKQLQHKILLINDLWKLSIYDNTKSQRRTWSGKSMLIR
jgi:hypothetical protein